MWLGVIRTESLFREMNERLSRVYRASSGPEPEYICECGDAACTKGIVLTESEYGAVRGHPTRFAIASGHEIERIERVVGVHERFTVVEKPVSL
jgi:Ni,Fe-hydrogenase III small subunit